MSYGIKLHVWGDYALFSRPEMKVERVSYDVITPSAARGVLEAIYWKPQIRWVVDRIHVLNPVKFTSVRRNELASKASATTAKSAMRSGSGMLGISIEDDRQQRAALLLREVSYVIEAHFDLLPADNDGPESGRVGKHLDMFKRRARAGQCFQQPYFGCREFPVSFSLIDGEASMPESKLAAEEREKDFGFMLHDILFDQDAKTKAVRDTMPRFYRAVMKNGIIDVPPLQSTHA